MLSNAFYQKIKANTQKNITHLCVGLDPDIQQLPDGFSKDVSGITSFLREIIDATQNDVIAYKPNLSFFEAWGIDGIKALKTICEHVPKHIPIILDAKKGDIGNTSRMQAKYIFEYLNADATTLHPYMGTDSLAPFFEYKDKFNFVLGLTSNPGAQDFEKQTLKNDKPLYESIIRQCAHWNQRYQNVGVVVGATQTELATIRQIDSNLLFLIPGVGAQGGDYAAAAAVGKNADDLAIVNVSRAILYCDKTQSFKKSISTAIGTYKTA